MQTSKGKDELSWLIEYEMSFWVLKCRIRHNSRHVYFLLQVSENKIKVKVMHVLQGSTWSVNCWYSKYMDNDTSDYGAAVSRKQQMSYMFTYTSQAIGRLLLFYIYWHFNK